MHAAAPWLGDDRHDRRGGADRQAGKLQGSGLLGGMVAELPGRLGLDFWAVLCCACIPLTLPCPCAPDPAITSPALPLAPALVLQTSVAGMIAVLESGVELQGTFHDYAGKVIPW